MNHLLDIRALYLLYDFPDIIICAKQFPYIVCNNKSLVKHGIHLHMHSNVRNVQGTFPFVQLSRTPQDLLSKCVMHEVCAILLPPINTWRAVFDWSAYTIQNLS